MPADQLRGPGGSPAEAGSENGADRFHAVIDMAAGAARLATVRDGLRRWLRTIGVGERQAGAVLLAAGEACANAWEHSGARAAGPGRPGAWVQAWVQDGQLHVTVTDTGRWKPPQPPIEPGVATRRGRGRMLMAALVDRVEVRTGPAGTVVELITRLQASEDPP